MQKYGHTRRWLNTWPLLDGNWPFESKWRFKLIPRLQARKMLQGWAKATGSNAEAGGNAQTEFKRLLQKLLGEPPGPVRRSDYIRIADSCFMLSDFCFLTFSRASDSSGLESRYYLGLATAAMKRISALFGKGLQYGNWGCDDTMHWLQKCRWCQFSPARLLVLTPAGLLLKWSGLRLLTSQPLHCVVDHFCDSNLSCSPGKIFY